MADTSGLAKVTIRERTISAGPRPRYGAPGGMVVASDRGPVKEPVLYSTVDDFKRRSTASGVIRVGDDNSVPEGCSISREI